MVSEFAEVGEAIERRSPKENVTVTTSCSEQLDKNGQENCSKAFARYNCNDDDVIIWDTWAEPLQRSRREGHSKIEIVCVCVFAEIVDCRTSNNYCRLQKPQQFGVWVCSVPSRKHTHTNGCMG